MWSTPKVDWKPIEYFNIEDWQRIRGNLEYLRDRLHAMGTRMPALLETDTGRGYSELPYVHLVNNMEQNLADLREILGADFTEEVAQKTWYARLDSMYTSNPTYQDWNRWERVLLLVYEAIQYIDTYVFSLVSGTSYCGEDRTLMRFSRGR